jgi:predicted DNA-binding protein (UPF0251 family)
VTAGLTPADRAALALAADVIDALPTVLLAELGRRGISQRKAAEQMGVDRQSVARWLRGETRPSAADLVVVFRWLAGGPE